MARSKSKARSAVQGWSSDAPDPQVWLTFSSGCYTWTVIVDPTLEDEGETVYEKLLIRIRPQEYMRMCVTLLHEMVHACMDSSGLNSAWAELGMVKPEGVEESVAHVLTPSLAHALISSGMVKFPPLPSART